MVQRPEEDNMTARNEGSLDRGIRIALGAVLLGLVFFGPQTPLGWVGLIPLITGLIGWCPVYRVLGINTCRVRE